jgi:hypothetical protein
MDRQPQRLRGSEVRLASVMYGIMPPLDTPSMNGRDESTTSMD